jgi:hypothetical protein
LLLAGLLAGPASAAPQPGPAPGPAPTAITLQRYAKFANGQLAVYTGEVAGTPHVYTLDNLRVLSPVFVTLHAPPGSGATLKISKFAEEPLRDATVDAKGEARVSFRTEGGFYARVSGPGPATRYSLYVVVGDEVASALPLATSSYAEFERRAEVSSAAQGGAPGGAGVGVVTPAAGAAAGDGAPPQGGPSGRVALWVIAVALSVIVALLAVLVWRRNKS